jgi:hypothetical protein
MGRNMLRRCSTVALFVFWSVAAHAATVLFQGTLTIDDQRPAILFGVSTTEVVTLQSFGYAGGAVDSSIIPSGGFDPDAFVFDYNTGALTAQYDGSSCITGNDPVTGFCNDPYIQQSYSPGLYALVLVVANNFPNDTNNLAAGFQEDGAGSYTCQLYSITGNFCDVSTATGTPRTGNWAVAITGADSAQPAPEPQTLITFAIGVAALALRRKRALRKPAH